MSLQEQWVMGEGRCLTHLSLRGLPENVVRNFDIFDDNLRINPYVGGG